MANKNIPYKIGYGFVKFFHKLKIIKKPEKAYKSIDKSINDFHISTEYIIKYKGKVAVSVLLSIVNLIFLFAIPYFIYIAFGHREKTIIDLCNHAVVFEPCSFVLPAARSFGSVRRRFLHILFSHISQMCPCLYR